MMLQITQLVYSLLSIHSCQAFLEDKMFDVQFIESQGYHLLDKLVLLDLQSGVLYTLD